MRTHSAISAAVELMTAAPPAASTLEYLTTFTRPSASVLGALTLAPFAIASPKALTEFKADEGTTDADGVFTPKEAQAKGAAGMLDALVRWAGALRPLRG